MSDEIQGAGSQAPVTQAPASPAPAPQPVQQSPAPAAAPTTAAERAMIEVNTGTSPRKKSFAEIEAEMNGTPAPSAQPNSAGQPSDGTQAGTGLPPQAGQPLTTEQPAAQVQPQVSAVEQELRAQLQAQQELLRQYAQPQGQVQQPPQGQQPPKDTTPDYNFDVPEQFLQGIRSEDPAQAKQALNGYTRAVMRTVHRTVAAENKAFNEALVTQVLPKMVQQYIEHNTVVRTVYEDFYNTHKELNKPELYPVIVKTAEAMMMAPDAAAQGFTTWGPKLRDALAVRVKGLLGMQAQPAQPAKKVPAMMAPGARPGVPAPTTDQALVNEIMAMKGH